MNLVILFLLFSTFISNAKEACSVVRVVDLSKTSKELLKESNLNFARTNMSEMCRRNLMLRYLNSKNLAPPDCEVWPIDKLEKFVDSNIQVEDQWNLSLLSTPKTRESSFASFYDWSKSCSDCPDAHEFKNLENVEKYFSTPRKEKPDFPLSVISKIQSSNSMDVGVLQLIKAESNKRLFCASEVLTKYTTCVNGLDFVEEKARIVHPKGYGLTFANLDLWKKIYSSDKYDEGLRLVALKIVDRVKNDIPASSNIFDDLQQSFLSTGLNKAEAREAAIDTLGLVSNGGPNTLRRAVKIGGAYSKKSLALGFIGNAMAFLDLKKQKQKGSLYSYPNSVSTNCDNAKPYHFWMAAYLAKEIKKTGYSSEDAELTVYLANQGYHLKRDIGYVQKNPDGEPAKKGPTKNAILTRAPFDPAHQIVRTDLAYAAAGAVFGARENGAPVNVDKIIAKLIENSSVETALSKQEASSLSMGDSYLRWSKIFSPNTALYVARGN